MTTSAVLPSIPSHLVDIPASQRRQRGDELSGSIERIVSASSNNEEHNNIDSMSSSTDRGVASSSRSKKKNAQQPPARHKRQHSAQSAGEKNTLLDEQDQTTSNQQLGNNTSSSVEMSENNQIGKRGEVDESNQSSAEDTGAQQQQQQQAKEKEENNNNSETNSFETKIAQALASVEPNSDVVLSLNDQHYKSVMWLHYQELGRNRDSDREAESADRVFQLFKQHMGSGKFYKLSQFGDKINVDEKLAHAKIIADIRRRLVSYKHWSIGMEGAEKKKSPSASSTMRKKRERPSAIEKREFTMTTEDLMAPLSPRRSTRTRNPPENQPQPKRMNYGSSGPAENDIVLSLNDERYREVMWKHFRLLGAKTPGDNSREEEIGNRLFQWFKTGLRRGGHFYKKEPRGDEIFLVDDELALRKIVRDLKRRMESSHKWYNHANASEDMDKLLRGSDDGQRSDANGQTNVFVTKSNTFISSASLPAQKSFAELLEVSHLGKRLPPISTLSSVRAIQTPNELLQTLLLATHKLNELSGTSSKHRKQLRLYELREFSVTYGLNPSVHKDIPSLAELAEFMETTPKSLRKWFRMYKKAVTRRFDFKTNGDDRIRDHYDVFYGSDHYQFSQDAEVAIEHFFEDTGKRILQDFESNVMEPNAEKSTSSLETSYNNEGNIFNRSPVDQIVDERPSRKVAMRIIQKEVDVPPPSMDGESVFQRHFQRNLSRLQSIPGCSLKLCPQAKRVEKGRKIRTICMVTGCEKQAQTKCDGCCTAHFRTISSVPYDSKKVVVYEPVAEESVEYMREESTPSSPSSGNDGGEKEQEVEEMDVERLQSGARIYVEWSGDDTLYKATVKKVMLYKKEPAVKIHYDGKKRHIHDTVPLNMVKGFIAGENEHIKTAVTQHEEDDPDSDDNDHRKKRARLNPPENDDSDDVDDTEVTYINFHNSASGPKKPPQSPMTRFSPISRNRDRGRSIVLISPISTKPIVASPSKLQKQLPTSAFIGIRSSQKPSVATSRIGTEGVEDSAKELFASKPEPEPSNIDFRSSQPKPEPESKFKCPKCSADCMYNSRMCSVCFMKSYYVSGQRSSVQQERYGTSDQRKYPSRVSVDKTKVQENTSKQKPLQSKPVVCHCPDCEKGDFTIQGMYAHWGRAHNVGKLPWNRVIYSCPFCNSQRKFNTLAAIESHANSAHPRCELLTPNTPKQSRSSSSSSCAPPNDRALRDRRTVTQPSTFATAENTEVYKPPPPAPLKFKKLEYAQLLPDGRKEYPRDLSRVIEMIDEQCRGQEEVVNTALDQRSKLCKSEADIEAKELKEERLVYQRGIRERTRMADQERIEKHRYNERHAEQLMRYEYENRNKTRDKEEIELNRLCSNPIIIATSKTRTGPENGAVCNDEDCQFCKEDSSYREHLLLDNEIPEFKLDFATDEALELHQRVTVLKPTVRTIVDSDFIDPDDDNTPEPVDKTIISTTTNGNKRSNSSRHVASTTNRLRTEEDKLLDLQYTKYNFEFIQKYNQGLIKNAWGERKDTRGRKPI